MIGQPTPCYLAFTTSTAAISQTIRTFDGGRLSHVAFLYWSHDYREWWIVHSDFPKIHAIPLREFETAGGQLVELWAFPSVDLFDGIRACRGDIGKAYDYAGLAGQASVKFWRLFGRLTRNPHDGATWFCSEWAVARVLPSVGIRFSLPHGSGAVSPGDLQALLETYPVAGKAPLSALNGYQNG